MIPNMAVLPLAKSTARAQIEKVQSTLRDERRNENTRHSGSAQGLELCAFVRWHGTWPDFWQLAVCSRAFVCTARCSQTDTTSTPSAFSSIAMVCRRIGIRIAFPRVERLQKMRAARAKGVQGLLNRPLNNSTQEVTQWKQLDC